MFDTRVETIDGFGCRYRVSISGISLFGFFVPMWKKTERI